jgi:hypothetical protein
MLTALGIWSSAAIDSDPEPLIVTADGIWSRVVADSVPDR